MIEVGIAAFAHDRFVRPYLGDSLAVLLVYCFIRAAAGLGRFRSATVAFSIACVIEFGQRIGLLHLLGLEHWTLARIVLGTGFDWWDFIAYAMGVLIVLAGECMCRSSARLFLMTAR